MAGDTAAGGKTDHANAVRINAPFLVLAPNQAHRSLPVLQSRLRVVRAAGHTVLEHDAGHANGRAPLSHVVAFVLDSEKPERSARSNYQSRSRVFLFCGS